MTRGDQAGRDPVLRARLEQIAASAGSPPEHGLVRVAELRRRRTRHRRGAVAATMALAVSGSLVVTLRDSGSQGDPDVAMSESPGGVPWQAALPDELHVQCSAEGIEVPVGFIRPRDDGLHLVVENDGALAVDLAVESEAEEPLAWQSGDVEVDPGETELVQPVPPGRVTVMCDGGGPGDRREVNVVDVDEVYEEPELSCPSYRQVVPEEDEVELEEEVDDRETAVPLALVPYFDEELDTVEPRVFYPDQDTEAPTSDPVMEVLREDEPVAWVALSGDAEGPWDEARVLSACQDYLAAEDAEDAAESGDAEDPPAAGEADDDPEADPADAADGDGEDS